MAWRRLTLAERFALRGATSYKPLLVEPAAIGDPKRCGWGFVPQSQLVQAMTSQPERYQFHVSVDKNGAFSEPANIAKDFERHGVDFQEFKEGASQIYEDITSLFCDKTVDFRDVELTSPRLSLFLNDCLAGYDDHGHSSPRIVVNSSTAMVQDILVQFGNVDHMGKWFGVYDGQEIRFHLLGGFSPEITTANEFMGDGPKRIVTSVLYEASEKVWFDRLEDEPAEWSNSFYYFEFESSLRGAISWRLRNVNKAIETP